MRWEATVEVKNKLGLHLRAASTLAQTAARFSAAITVTRGKHQVNAKSVTSLMVLGAGIGTKLESGPRARTRAARRYTPYSTCSRTASARSSAGPAKS